MERQVKSKQRVADHGEVFTADREVQAMCDLVKQETERIDSRFLEPACGEGNFLAEILKRKLAIVKKKYRRSAYDWERNSLLALGSMYGVDIMLDNAIACRQRLYDIWEKEYKAVCKKECKDIGGWDTVIKRAEYDQLFYNQQATMEAPTIIKVPQLEDIPVPAKKPTITSAPVHTSTAAPAQMKPTPSVTTQYGVKPAVSATAKPAAKKEEFVAPDVKDGSIVLHKAFGEGTVTKIDKAQKHIRVTFGIGEKTFIFPDAFKQGFLKMKGE